MTGFGATVPEPFVHLVIDLGSSGTRFCLYEVRSLPDGSGCGLRMPQPVCSRVKGGLARLTRGHRVSHVAGLIAPQLQRAWTLLGDAASGGDPLLRSRVRAATALGTGGFRDKATGQPIRRPEWQVLFAEVERFLKRETGLAHVTARPITGEEEGRFAWLGVAQGQERPNEFATVEAGGATIQLAVGKKGSLPAAIEVATDPIGQDVVFDRFLSNRNPLGRGFQVCYSPTRPQRQDGALCIDLLSAEIFGPSAVRRLAERNSARRLFGLGLSFTEIFRRYPAGPPWSPKQDAAMHAKLTFDHVRQLAKLLCPMTDAEIAKYAPKALAIRRDLASGKSPGSGRACYYLAYSAALLDAVRHIAADAELHAAGDDQWPSGAAVSGDFHASCR